MPECPRCHQSITAEAIACPYCRTTLKAFGHPGITLHRADGDRYLCQTCTYDDDQTCTFPQRPHAQECTLYRRIGQTTSALNPAQPTWGKGLNLWLRRNVGLLLVIGLIAVSLVLALTGR